ncbi:MAG: hypothetical protein IMF08_06260 [Proteobacteria bacterium]|nr:hypothetical protein [Pseudomonadota bacterium]
MLDELSRNWTGAEEIRNWVEIKAILAEYRAFKDKAEELAATADGRMLDDIVSAELTPRTESLLAMLLGSPWADGDYDAEVPATNKLDEIGDFARAIEKIRDMMRAGGVRGARSQGPSGRDAMRNAWPPTCGRCWTNTRTIRINYKFQGAGHNRPEPSSSMHVTVDP